MKCTIPAQNVGILARALHSLSRVGDELFVDPLTTGLTFCSVNTSQSAFAEFIFLRSFFSSYSIGVDDPTTLPKCKISMRSCLSVFKTPNCVNKMVDWCQLRLEPDGVQFIFQIKFSGGSIKTHFLPIIECETLQVKYDKSKSTRLVATSKLLSGVLKHFRLNEDEITLSITKQKTTFRNHIDSINEKNKSIRTEMALLAGEFELYSVNESVSLTFCLKQLRAAVTFAEATGLPVTICFETPGRPVIFTACNETVYEANFVVSSLQSTADSQSQRTVNSNVFITDDSQQMHLQEHNVVPDKNSDKVNVIPSSSRNAVLSSVSMSNELACQSTSRKRPRNADELITKSTNGNEIYRNSVNSKGSSTQDTILIENNNNMDVDNNIPNSPQNSPKLLNNVFGRCFNSTFQKSLLPGFDNVIAYDSDGLEDSD